MRVKIRAEIKAILKQAQVTTIFVTHDKEEAMFLADRIAIMNEGGIEQIDTPEQIYNKPSTKFVAEFMDPASFIDVTVDDPHTITTEIGVVSTIDPIEVTGEKLHLLLRGNNIILSDTDGSSSISFGVFGVPETILINSNQIVIKKFIGPLDTKDYKNILNVIYEN